MITTPNNFRDNYVVVLDSLDRDLEKYPDPSNYVIALPETLRNVETIELMSFQMTRTETNVNTGNNKFKIIEILKTLTVPQKVTGTHVYTIEIPVNEYATVSDFITALNNVLPRNTRGNYTATVDNDNKIKISHPSASGNDSISFGIQVDESVAKLLGITGTSTRGSGLIESSTTSSGTVVVTITGKNSIDLAGVPYIILYLNDYERIIAPGSKTHKNFLVVPMENHEVGKRFIISGDQKEKKGIYILTNNQKNIYEMRVSINRPDGTLYDFKGTDHLLIFRIYRHDYRDFNS